MSTESDSHNTGSLLLISAEDLYLRVLGMMHEFEMEQDFRQPSIDSLESGSWQKITRRLSGFRSCFADTSDSSTVDFPATSTDPVAQFSDAIGSFVNALHVAIHSMSQLILSQMGTGYISPSEVKFAKKKHLEILQSEFEATKAQIDLLRRIAKTPAKVL